MLRGEFYSAFSVYAMLVNRYRTIVENTFHKVWNGQIDKHHLGLVWKRMEKR